MTIIERVLLLQGIDLFADVTTEQLSFLAAIAEEMTFDPGRVIYSEGDPPDGLYAVISGTVRMKRSGEGIDTIGVNGAFGVWALFDDEPRLTTAEAKEEAQPRFSSCRVRPSMICCPTTSTSSKAFSSSSCSDSGAWRNRWSDE